MGCAPVCICASQDTPILTPHGEVPIADLREPNDHLCALLEGLAAAPGVRVAVLSGRSIESLDRFIGHLPLALVAEHGVWSRAWGGEWTRCRRMRNYRIDGPPAVRAFLARFPECRRGDQGLTAPAKSPHMKREPLWR